MPRFRSKRERRVDALRGIDQTAAAILYYLALRADDDAPGAIELFDQCMNVVDESLIKRGIT